MSVIATWLDNINERFGRALALTPLALVIVQFSIVLLVYVFGVGSIKLQESLQYINALMFLGGAGFTALHNDHVRVDIFYGKMLGRNKKKIDLLGTFIFLWPMLILLWYLSIPYVLESWKITEGSIETNGLPFVYILKTTILLFCLTMSVFALSQTIKLLCKLFNKGNA